MCLDLAWNTVFFVIAIVDMLSHIIVVGFEYVVTNLKEFVAAKLLHKLLHLMQHILSLMKVMPHFFFP